MLKEFNTPVAWLPLTKLPTPYKQEDPIVLATLEVVTGPVDIDALFVVAVELVDVEADPTLFVVRVCKLFAPTVVEVLDPLILVVEPIAVEVPDTETDPVLLVLELTVLLEKALPEVFPVPTLVPLDIAFEVVDTVVGPELVELIVWFCDVPAV